VLLLLVLGAAGVGLIAAGNLDLGPVVITREGEQKIILLFGDARKVTTPGASLRIPLLEDVERYDARWLWLDTERRLIPTKDEERIVVDNYVVWRIQDAVAYRRAFRGELARAEERIDKVVGNDVREVIGQYTLTDVLKDKRIPIMEMITEKTRGTLAEYGIQVAGVRINRTELPEGTEENVYARMKTERERLAKKSRAEGQERARRIRAEADRDARVIVANAKRDAEIARGEGDAEAARIYAEAYGEEPGFYDFLRSLEAYEKTIGERTTLVLSPKSEFFRFLESATPEELDGGPAPR
jgi:membrane protease subunit HflC